MWPIGIAGGRRHEFPERVPGNHRKFPPSGPPKSWRRYHKPPRAVGYGEAGNWDTRVFRGFLRDRYPLVLSRSGCTPWLHRHGFSWTRPTDVLAKADPERQKVWVQALQELKKLTVRDVLLFEDEAPIRDYPAIGTTWFLRGQPKKVRTTGRHAAATLMGAVAPATGDVVVREYLESTAATFQQFLDVIRHH